MAHAIERRLSALERQACASEQSLTVVFLDSGESEAEALTRAGHPADSGPVICVSFVSPLASSEASLGLGDAAA